MANCYNDCIHCFVCQYVNHEEYPSVQQLKDDCRHFHAVSDIAPKSEVASEIIAEFKEMAKSRLLECGLYLAVFKNTLAYVEEELKKKYTEGE